MNRIVEYTQSEFDIFHCVYISCVTLIFPNGFSLPSFFSFSLSFHISFFFPLFFLFIMSDIASAVPLSSQRSASAPTDVMTHDVISHHDQHTAIPLQEDALYADQLAEGKLNFHQ